MPSEASAGTNLEGLGLDPHFLRSVYLLSAGVALLGGLVLAGAVQGWSWGAGFAVAAVWSIANFWALELLMRLAVRPTGRNPLAILVAAFVKIPLVYGIGALIALKGGLPIVSLIAGVSVPLVVVVLKVAGQLLSGRATPARRTVPASRGEGR